MKAITLSDPTLRDGNHAVAHQLTAQQIAAYCRAADAAGIHVVEVGHGNGLGASSLQLGESACVDDTALRTAREALSRSKLGVHVIPGFATIQRDLGRALDLGVDVVRVASHCTEADLTQRHIAFTCERGRTAYGVLMMSHMASKERLVEEGAKMVSYGAQGIVIMDSAGSYFPADVTERIGLLVRELGVMVGFHAHNNLGMAIANSVAALEAGATMLDGCARGFGAGAGNAAIEVLVPVVERLGYTTGLDLYKLLDAADLAERDIIPALPAIRSTSIVSGLAGVFSGFAKPVERIAKHYGVDPRDVFFELGRRRIVAGQEDMILEVASELAKRTRAPAEGRA
jgi:4-hydroxy 2-oxovalerate aldolase